MLNWALVRGTAAIPKSSSLKNQASNIDVFDFCLTEQEMAEIATDVSSINFRLCDKRDFSKGYSMFA